MPLLPLSDLADTFPGIVDLPGQLGERTLEEYRMDIQHYLAWCGYEPERALEPQTLRSWRVYMVEHTEFSPWTINRRLSAVKCAVRASAVTGSIDHGVAYRFSLVERVPLFSLRARLKQHRPVTPDQIREFCRAPDPTTLGGLRDRALLATLVGSGCRVSEVVGMKISDLIPYQGAWLVLVLGKGQYAVRQVPLSKEAYNWISRWLSGRATKGVELEQVFTGFSGRYYRPTRRPISRTAAWRRVKKYARQVGLPTLTPHDLRRFVGTQVAEKHGLRQAQKVLGHARLDTTMIYVLDDMLPGLTDGLY